MRTVNSFHRAAFLRWQAPATRVTRHRPAAGPGGGPADCAASSRRTSPGNPPRDRPQRTGRLRLAPGEPAQGTPPRAGPAGWPRGPADWALASGEFWARRGAAILRWQCAQRSRSGRRLRDRTEATAFAAPSNRWSALPILPRMLEFQQGAEARASVRRHSPMALPIDMGSWQGPMALPSESG